MELRLYWKKLDLWPTLWLCCNQTHALLSHLPVKPCWSIPQPNRNNMYIFFYILKHICWGGNCLFLHPKLLKNPTRKSKNIFWCWDQMICIVNVILSFFLSALHDHFYGNACSSVAISLICHKSYQSPYL